MSGSLNNVVKRNVLFFGVQPEGESFAALVSPHFDVHITTDTEEAKHLLQNELICTAITTSPLQSSVLNDFTRLTFSEEDCCTQWILTGQEDFEEGMAMAKSAQMQFYIQQPWQYNEVRNVLEGAHQLAVIQQQHIQLNARYQKELNESRAHEAALEASEERMKLALQTAKFGIWDWDITKNELKWDPSMFDIFGVNEKDFKGAYEAWEQTVHPEDLPPANAEVQLALNGKKPFDIEFRILRFGKVAYIRGIGKVNRDEHGNPTRMLGVNYDITDERIAEEKLLVLKENLEQIVSERTSELQKARDEADQANQAKSMFLSRMSHELRTPLNSIIGFSHLLLLADSNPDQNHNAKRIYKAGKHLLILINDVLDISQIESGQTSYNMTSVDIRTLMDEVFELMSDTAREKDVTLIPTNPTEAHAHADYNRLRQVLLNLISNGIKYNRAQGELKIEVEQIDDMKKVLIHVCDTGQGIPHEKHHRLFTPFDRLGVEKSSTYIEGTGLGLALSKSLIEGMGGDIRITKSSPEGSVFTVTLKQS